MMNCPVCKASNDIGPQCRRCKADLSLLFALEDQRGQALAAAYRAAAKGQWRRVTTLVEGVEELRRDAEAGRLLAISYLMQRDFARAWEQYQASRGA